MGFYFRKVCAGTGNYDSFRIAMKLLFANEGKTALSIRFTAAFFKPLLQKALKILMSPPYSEQIPETEVELVLLDDSAMQAINKQTRGLDKTTDVLSFANREVLVPPANHSLGQIFISIPATERNATEMHQSIEEELHFLFIHGFLHILGYDHQNPKDEIEMMTVAYKILGRPPYRS